MALRGRPAPRAARDRPALQGAAGTNGGIGSSGTNGLAGTNGSTGSPARTVGPGASGTNGTNGLAGTNGGQRGLAGTNGAAGLDGNRRADGADGLDGANGTIAPLSATEADRTSHRAARPTTVVELTVPAGKYVVLAKMSSFIPVPATRRMHAQSRWRHPRPGRDEDSACARRGPGLAAGGDDAAPATLSVECDVPSAGGTADFSSLIVVPTA